MAAFPAVNLTRGIFIRAARALSAVAGHPFLTYFRLDFLLSSSASFLLYGERGDGTRRFSPPLNDIGYTEDEINQLGGMHAYSRSEGYGDHHKVRGANLVRLRMASMRGASVMLLWSIGSSFEPAKSTS